MNKKRIAITMGDPAGIGPEIVSTAVQDPEIQSICEPIVIADPVAFALHNLPLPTVEMLSVPGLRKRLRLGQPSQAAGTSALECLEKGAALLESRNVSAIVTAPVSKQSLQLTTCTNPGHTEWFANRFNTSNVAMLMVADSLRTILLTRHVPIVQVASKLTVQTILDGARLGHAFVKTLLRKSKPRIALCGLNPHAGDNGILGSEELKVMRPAVARLAKERLPVLGPYAVDSVFRDMKAGLFDLALAAYHDQGMIALKVHAPNQLVNVTLGLPYIRTSPGHGTAYDIAGKRKANAEPMKEAIRLAVAYSR